MRNKLLLPITLLYCCCLIQLTSFEQQLDSSFSANGIVVTPIGNTADRAIDMTIDNNNRVVTAGQTFNGSNYDVALTRYNTDGSIDNSFGNNGIVITAIGNSNDYSDGIAVQPDGKIVVCGYFDDGDRLLTISLLRFNDDGSPDASFGSNGVVTLDRSEGDDMARDVRIQPDGKIVVTGSSFNGADMDIILARFNSNGTPDFSFNGTGIVLQPIGNSNDFTFQLAIQPDNKIVAAGYIITQDLSKNIVIVRRNPDGSPDNTFGEAGVSLTAWADPVYPNFDAAYALTLQNGRIILGGYARGLFVDVDNYIAVARYTENGSLDSSFGNNGIFKTIFGPVNNFLSESVTALAVQADGKIVASAHSSVIGFNADFMMFRLTADGALDNTFGGTGFITTPLSVGDDLAGSVAVQPDGKIVLGGYSFDSTRDYDFAVVRYLSDGGACGTPPNTLTSSIATTSARLKWKPLPRSLASYKLRYRVKNTSAFRTIRLGSNSSQFLTNLAPSTQYEWQVQSDCGASISAYSTVNTFKTKGATSISGSFSQELKQNSASVNVYPNPVGNNVTITFESVQQAACEIRVTDIQGKVLQRLKVATLHGANKQTVDLSGLSAGLYILYLQQGYETSIIRIVKQ